MEWVQETKTVWTTNQGEYRVVLFSYEQGKGRSFFWDVFDTQRDIASGTASSLEDAKRMAESQVRGLEGNKRRVAVGNYPPGVPRTGV